MLSIGGLISLALGLQHDPCSCRNNADSECSADGDDVADDCDADGDQDHAWDG